MKQLLLENPRRSRRMRRNGTFGRRTPLSPLYRNKPIATGMVSKKYSKRFDAIFGSKPKRKKTKGKRKSMAKRRQPAGLRKYWAKKRAMKAKRSSKRRSSPKRRSRSKRRRLNKGLRRYQATQRRIKRSYRRSQRKGMRVRTRRKAISIPRKTKVYKMKIRINRRGGSSLRGFVGQFTSRENLSLAGGVLLAPIVTKFVADLLPAGIKNIGGAGTNVNKALIIAGVAGLGAMLTNRFSPAIAKGMVISGLANSISLFIPSTPASTTPVTRFLGEYLDPARTTGAYIAPQRMGRMNSPAGMSSAGVPSAFNAWAK